MSRGTDSTKRRALLGTLLCLTMLVAFASGCGGSEEAKTEFSIAISAPTSGPLADRGRDMIDAAQLALELIDNDTATTQLTVESSATTDSNTVAAIAALKPIDSAGSLTIDLTPPTGFQEFENRIWLLPFAESNGEAVAQFGASSDPRSLDPVGGDGVFNAAVKRGVKEIVDNAGIATGGAALPVSTPEYAGAMADDQLIVADNPMVPGVPPFTYVTPALSKENYPPAGLRFFDAFIKEYGRVPDRFAIFAYEAVGLVVDAIRRLEDADEPVTPDTVQRSAFAIKDRFSPVGHYDVLPSGATTLYVFQARGKDAPPPESALIEVRR